jgi:hypothetical protein
MTFEDIKNNNTKTKCIVLACGPSLSEVDDNKIRELSEEYLIATIKQAYVPLSNYSDFQFFNCNNLIVYPRHKAKFICCSPTSLETGKRGLWKNQEIDLFFHMTNTHKRLKHFANTEDWFVRENMGKHLGPGIMVEIVLPFFYNLGVTEIITAGWDYLSKDGAPLRHFYPENIRGKFTNPAANFYNGEILESIQNSERINSFFKKSGVALKCLKSEKCFLHESIERVTL